MNEIARCPLPCPFCGKPPEVTHMPVELYNGCIPTRERASWMIRCASLSCCGPSAHSETGEADAIEKWNRRPAAPDDGKGQPDEDLLKAILDAEAASNGRPWFTNELRGRIRRAYKAAPQGWQGAATMKINPEMVVLAREYRGLTQEGLASKLLVSQAKIAKIEGGFTTDLGDATLTLLTKALEFPVEFFTQDENRISYGSSSYFYRKKASLNAADRKRIHGLVNILRINIKQMLQFVEIEKKRKLPSLPLEEYGGSPARVAQAIRALWQLPEGPINNITALIEGAGIVIVDCDFGTRYMDATSIWLADMPPMIFINQDLPGDRRRFSLAHELGHLLMHEIPQELMEEEADSFASEFLMPEIELKAQFMRMASRRLQDFANLKPYWKVSIAALIKRAEDLRCLAKNQARYLWMQMAKAGYRLNEPQSLAIPREAPSTHSNLLGFFQNELNYSVEDLCTLLKIPPNDLKYLHNVTTSSDSPKTRLLRVVRP